MFFTGSANFRPDLSFVVMAGDQLVGFSYNTVCTEANARQGLQEGWIGDLGVRRAWRRRGIATALLCASMQAFCAAGLAYATLGVDTENLTGALRLYERLGFVADRRSIAFEKKF
jgi:ribosomal protein S18 acetylase RimI-like enzyme